MVNPATILEKLRGADRRALPRLATLLENGDPAAHAILEAIFSATGRAHTVGITGPPGAGKSSLIAALIEELRAAGQRIAVIAVDPSSTLSGGAVLGDRIRMMDRHGDDGVFVRSMASRGRQGGLAWTTASLVHLFDAAGYDVILIETVGTGQDGTDIASLADTVVVVEAPGLGDGVQAIKSGLLEVGDIVVVNKADLPGAEDTLRILRASFELGHSRGNRRIPVFGTVSSNGKGVERLRQEIAAHGQWLDESGERAVRRLQAARAEVLAGVRSEIDRRLDKGNQRTANLNALIGRVAQREMSPQRAIAAIAAGIDTLLSP